MLDIKDGHAPMPPGVEAMTKQELWDWFHRSQCAAAEQQYLKERFFSVTTGLHSARVSMLGNPHAIIEEQRKRMRGLEQQMAEMQKGYDKKLRKAVAAAVSKMDRGVGAARDTTTAPGGN